VLTHKTVENISWSSFSFYGV